MALQGKDLPSFTRVKIQKRYTKPLTVEDTEELSDRWHKKFHRLLKHLHRQGYNPDDLEKQPTYDSYIMFNIDGDKIAEIKRAEFKVKEKQGIVQCNFYYRILTDIEDKDDNQTFSL